MKIPLSPPTRNCSRKPNTNSIEVLKRTAPRHIVAMMSKYSTPEPEQVLVGDRVEDLGPVALYEQQAERDDERREGEGDEQAARERRPREDRQPQHRHAGRAAAEDRD